MATPSASRLEQALRDEVREELRRVVELDALADEHDEVRQVVRRLVDAANHRAAAVGEQPLPDLEGLADRLVDEILGLGPLQPLLDDAGIVTPAER